MKAVVKLLSMPKIIDVTGNCALQDTLEGFAVAEAKPREVRMVLEVLNEAADWLRLKGIDQWQSRYFTQSVILEGIRKREVYLARQENKVVGTITIQWSDPLFWGDTPMDAAYFHRLAIKREYAGKGLGHALVEWAEGTAKAAGKSYLRLNCTFENQRLRQYYEDMDYAYRGEAKFRDLRFALYEKQL